MHPLARPYDQHRCDGHPDRDPRGLRQGDWSEDVDEEIATLLIPITMTVAKAAGLNPIVCGLIVTIVIDSVILYPVQTATNLLAYESGYYGSRDVGRFGFMMLCLTMIVGLGIAIPCWSALGLPLTLR